MQHKERIMTKKNQFILFFCFFLVLMASGFQSCAEKDELIEQTEQITGKLVPITFGGEQAGEDASVTRADQTLGHDFILYGYKTLAADDISEVFKTYTVHYAANTAGSSDDNTHNYYYVDPDNHQYIKYWDYSATEYRYWGYVGNANIRASANDGRTLSISGIAMGIDTPKGKDGENKDIGYLISSLKVVPKTDFGKVVQLRFIHPYAKVRVMVYSGENFKSDDASNSGDDVIELSAISFGPNDGSPIVSAGNLEVSYPSSGDAEIFKISSPETKAKLGYKDITLTSDNCTSNTAATAVPDAPGATTANEYFYVLPFGANAISKDFKFSASYNGKTKTAIVPAAYMRWKPNYSYTYIFKISDGTMLFVDAEIAEWESGGSGSVTWPNW